MKRLIILRGNSGSGKTTVAKLLQERLGRHTMLISQDVIRREVLKVKETEDNPTMDLIQQMTSFGWQHGWGTVIIEGIFHKDKYRFGLKTLIDDADAAHIFYFDIPFDETVRRHATKPNASDFGEETMREWWKDQDYLKVENEEVISSGLSAEEIVMKISNIISGESK